MRTIESSSTLLASSVAPPGSSAMSAPPAKLPVTGVMTFIVTLQRPTVLPPSKTMLPSGSNIRLSRAVPVLTTTETVLVGVLRPDVGASGDIGDLISSGIVRRHRNGNRESKQKR